MPTELVCPKCETTQVIPDEAAGRAVRCPACKADVSPGAGRSPTPWRSFLVWAFIALVLASGAVLALYLSADRTKPVDFADPDGIFSARFPSPPESKLAAEPNPLMLRWGEQVYRATGRGGEYSVTVLTGMNEGDEPYGPAWRDANIKRVFVVAIANASGQQLIERKVDHQGHPAGEIVFSRRDDNSLTAVRVVAGENHVLRLMVTGSGDKALPDEFLARADEFFSGVQVKPGFGPPIVDEPQVLAAADLVTAYRADAPAADAKFKGRWLRVTGSVKEVTGNGNELVLAAGDGTVLVQRAPRARRTVAVRGSGANVELTARCRGLAAADGAEPRVLLEHAVVVRQFPPK